ncbi:patatin [candidate division LCP-89 bacterium B3_LCP]|uniref:Patatin n=1 Tax=candidate division LCP-89 bacterium B3_LCP TaxID=2012998 RepID=A0A532UXP4_UNCL8|nr:MAG: patatin [candidate division LCP-89 bacterium B3_LCP]
MLMFTRIKPKVGLALGGGGARGFAHLGILNILEKEGFPVDLIVGTSMGAIVGSLYARLNSAKVATEHFQQILNENKSDVHELNVYQNDGKGDHLFDHIAREIKQRITINLSISRQSLFSSERLQRAVHCLFDDCQIEELPIKFAAAASDLISGKGVIINKGSLRNAVIASSSIPGFFPPVSIKDYLLVDGEVTDLIPVEACYALGADMVIAVDVRRTSQTTQKFQHTIDIFMRSAQVTGYRYTDTLLKNADFVIRPTLLDVHWSDFDRFREMVNSGEEAAANCLSDLQAIFTSRQSGGILNKLKKKHKNRDNVSHLEHIDLIEFPP